MEDFSEDDDGSPPHPLPDGEYALDYIVSQLANKEIWRTEWIEEHVTYLKAMRWFMFQMHSNKAMDKHFEWQRQQANE